VFDRILEQLQVGFAGLPDPRPGGNRTTYAIADAVLSAFSVFVMQSPSFLAHQREMQGLKGRDNLQTLFGVHTTPNAFFKISRSISTRASSRRKRRTSSLLLWP
jgi:hypothetical protein